MRIGFIGGAYKSQSFAADVQSCVNLMVEKDESGAGKNDVILVNTPGLSLPIYQLPDTPSRSGMIRITVAGEVERCFTVSGSTLYELFTDGTFANRGAVGNDGKPVSFANNNIQLMLASAGKGYCLDLASNTLTGPIATITGVVQVVFSDGFFLALIGNSARFFVSNPEDGTTWDPANTAIVSVFADNVVSMGVVGRQICLLGQKKSVFYYDSGPISDVDSFNFAPVPGGLSEQGSAATFGITTADNTIFGIWKDDAGNGIAFRVNGNTFTRISTHAIENEWQGYPTISDAVCFTYQDRGHIVVQWNFPSAVNGNGRTWCYDVTSGLWFEKAFYQNGVKKMHRSCCHAFFGGKHLVGDPLSGNIYQMSEPVSNGAGGWNFVTDFGNPIIRERVSPYIGDDSRVNSVYSLEVLGDTGLGPNIPLQDGSGNARGPQLMLSYSDDLGNTWSNEILVDMGQIGKFSTRMRVFRLGSFWGSIGRVWKLTFSDPAPLRLVDLVIDPPIQRLAQKLRAQA